MTVLDAFRHAMAGSDAPRDVDGVTRLLGTCVRDACAGLGLTEADIHDGGGWVTMLLTPKHAWEAVVEGPDAYQLYPGHIRENGDIVWPNIWVAEPYDLPKFVNLLEDALQEASAD
ncbi:MAG: hypothetical protein GC155_14630 [Alphaproteobacteria bacterium]|nr:hypothetical protein [Alphaproteobacteria bacterium]